MEISLGKGSASSTVSKGFQGIGSGMSTDDKINKSLEQRAAALNIDGIESKIEQNIRKAAELKTLSYKLENLKTSLNELRGTAFGESSNLLQAKKITLSTTTQEAGSSFVEAGVSSSANTGGHTLEVTQIALNRIEQFTNFTSDTLSATNPVGDHTAGKFTPGTFQINGEDVTIDDGDSLNEIRNKINAISTTTNVEATILIPSTGNYKLILKSTETGTANTFVITDADLVLNGMNTLVQAAQNAEFELDSIAFIRSSNVVTDAIDGATLEFFRPTLVKVPDGVGGLIDLPVTLNLAITNDYDVANDNSIASTAIEDFVSKFNELIKYSTKQNRLDPINGEYHKDAILKNYSFLSNLVHQITVEAGGVAFVQDSAKDYFSKVGLTFYSIPEDPSNDEPAYKNLLQFNKIEFQEAIQTNYDDVAGLFEYKSTSTNDKFYVVEHGNSLNIHEFTIDVDTGRPADQIAQVTYGGNTYDLEYTAYGVGGLIKGVQGTIFEGYEIMYTGAGVDNTDFTVEQGIADRLYNVVDTAFALTYSAAESSTPTYSEFDYQVIQLRSENADYKEDLLAKQENLLAYKEQLIDKYARSEGLIAMMNIQIMMIEAQMAVFGK